MDYNQFAESVKAAHPEYADRDNATLAKAMLTKFPAYADRVDTTGLGLGPTSTAAKLNPINQAAKDAQQFGYSGLKPDQQALIDAQFPSSAAASKGMSLAEVHAAMDAGAQKSSPQQQAHDLASNPQAVLQPQDVLYPSSSANTVQDVTGVYTAPLSGLLSMGHDIGSMPGRALSAAGAAGASVLSDVNSNINPLADKHTDFDWYNTLERARDAAARSMADPEGSNIVSSILKDPLTGVSLGGSVAEDAAGKVLAPATEYAVHAIPRAAKWAAEKLPKVANLVSGARTTAGTVANEHPFISDIAKNAALGVGASGLEHALYTGSDYQPGYPNPLPMTGSGVSGAVLTAAPAVAAALLRNAAINNYPGQRPMETMQNKQTGANQLLTRPERADILGRVANYARKPSPGAPDETTVLGRLTQSPFAAMSQEGYMRVAKDLKAEAQAPMDKVLNDVNAEWESRVSRPQGDVPKGLLPTVSAPMTVNDMISLAAAKSKQHAGMGKTTGEGAAWDESALRDFAQPTLGMYELTNAPSKRWRAVKEQGDAAYTKLNEAHAARGIDRVTKLRDALNNYKDLVDKVVNGNLYSKDMYREDLAKVLGLLNQKQTLKDLSPVSAEQLERAEQLHPYIDVVEGSILHSRKLNPRSYPVQIGASEEAPQLDLGEGGGRLVSPAATVPIRGALNAQIYNRKVDDKGNARRQLAGDVKDVIRDFLNRYGYDEKLKALDPEANRKYAMHGKITTYIQKSPTRGQPIRATIPGVGGASLSAYTYDPTINNYNKPAMLYAGSRLIGNLIAPTAGSRMQEKGSK